MRALRLACLVLAACGPNEPARATLARRPEVIRPNVVADESFRNQPPTPRPEIPFRTPETVSFQMANGLHVIVSATPANTLALRVVLPVDASAYGASEVMIRAMVGRSTARPDDETRRTFEQALGEVRWVSSSDYLGVDFVVPTSGNDLTAQQAEAVKAFAELVEHPAFEDTYVANGRAEVYQDATSWYDNPSSVAWHALAQALFGSHAYAHSRGSGVTQTRPNRADVLALYDAIVDPTTATLVVASALNEAALKRVIEPFTSWKSTPHARPKSIEPPATPPPSADLIVIDRPGAAQAIVMYGCRGPARFSESWSTLEIVHQLLGATSASRLPRRIDQAALTWSGFTHLEEMRNASMFFWRSAVPAARVADVLREVEHQFSDLRDHEVSAAQLRETVLRYVRVFPTRFETASDVAHEAAEIPQYGLSLDTWSLEMAAMHSLDPQKLHAFTSKAFAKENVRTIVVGDWSLMKTALGELNWGRIEVRDGRGVVIH